MGITGPQEAGQLLVSIVVESLLRLGQQAPAPIEGIGLVTTVSERVPQTSVAVDVVRRRSSNEVTCSVPVRWRLSVLPTDLVDAKIPQMK